MAQVTITGNHHPPYLYDGALWSHSEIKRINRTPSGVSRAGRAVITKVLRHGSGVTVDCNGLKVRCQIWADHPHQGKVWLKVYEGDAKYPGEFAEADVDKDGKITNVCLAGRFSRDVAA